MASIARRGNLQWRARIRIKGYPVQTRTFETRTDAEAWAKITESEMVRGVFVSQKEAENTTLTEALERYEREVSSRKKGYAREKTRIKNWMGHDLAKRSLASIRGSDMAKYRDARIKSGYASNTVRLELAVLSHLFETARKEWGMEGLSNPVKSIRMPSPPEGRDRRLKTGELDKILENTSEEMGRIIRFALETGMRRSEIAGMTWESIDLKKRVVTLSETKNGTKRIVPLSRESLRILSEIPRRIDGKVWGVAPDTISQDFAQACHKSGIEGLTFHDLRHEATSRFFEKGLNPMQVAAITGHKTLQMLRRYTHLRAEDLAELLN